ncbi:MAG: hypothetical protein ABI583_02070, partial [Betaproteobacteria bacterium]
MTGHVRPESSVTMLRNTQLKLSSSVELRAALAIRNVSSGANLFVICPPMNQSTIFRMNLSSIAHTLRQPSRAQELVMSIGQT